MARTGAVRQPTQRLGYAPDGAGMRRAPMPAPSRPSGPRHAASASAGHRQHAAPDDAADQPAAFPSPARTPDARRRAAADALADAAFTLGAAAAALGAASPSAFRSDDAVRQFVRRAAWPSGTRRRAVALVQRTSLRREQGALLSSVARRRRPTSSSKIRTCRGSTRPSSATETSGCSPISDRTKRLLHRRPARVAASDRRRRHHRDHDAPGPLHAALNGATARSEAGLVEVLVVLVAHAIRGAGAGRSSTPLMVK